MSICFVKCLSRRFISYFFLLFLLCSTHFPLYHHQLIEPSPQPPTHTTKTTATIAEHCMLGHGLRDDDANGTRMRPSKMENGRKKKNSNWITTTSSRVILCNFMNAVIPLITHTTHIYTTHFAHKYAWAHRLFGSYANSLNANWIVLSYIFRHTAIHICHRCCCRRRTPNETQR